MAVTVIQNKKGTAAVIHVTSANGYVLVSGNSSTSNINGSNTCLAIADEQVRGVTITQAFWGIDPSSDGHVVIKRGSNVVAVFDSTGYKDYAGNGMALSKDASANLVIEFASSANSYVMLELQKDVAVSNSDYFRS